MKLPPKQWRWQRRWRWTGEVRWGSYCFFTTSNKYSSINLSHPLTRKVERLQSIVEPTVKLKTKEILTKNRAEHEERLEQLHFFKSELVPLQEDVDAMQARQRDLCSEQDDLEKDFIKIIQQKSILKKVREHLLMTVMSPHWDSGCFLLKCPPSFLRKSVLRRAHGSFLEPAWDWKFIQVYSISVF